MQTLIKRILTEGKVDEPVTAAGWVRTRRDSKEFSFLELNDGSSLRSLQVIADAGITGYQHVGEMTTGASVRVTGKLVESQGQGQRVEVLAEKMELLGGAPDDFPLQKKRHSQEFLRSIAHLRPRTNLHGAVLRQRSRMALAVHRFFEKRDFVHIHTPIITASDCEGAGEMFQVTTNGAGPPNEDFFGKKTFLTVSGQLEGEAMATALSRIYTFGPTFRAENSNTARHAAEFWMIEPEVAFCDLAADMDLAEEFLRELVREFLDDDSGDVEFFGKFVDKGLRARLEPVANGKFERLSYTEAVARLEKSGREFEHEVRWGVNLQSEHERYLCEEVVKGPMTVYNYPDAIKPFYMRANEDGKTVTAMDVLVPGVGEIMGGSQREERLDVLQERMARHDLNSADYQWYLDLRKFGSVPHAGFGMGFERLLMYLTGVANIRDAIPFARTPGHCEF